MFYLGFCCHEKCHVLEVTNRGERVYFSSQVQVVLPVGKTWRQELEAAGHMIVSFTAIHSVSLADDS